VVVEEFAVAIVVLVDTWVVINVWEVTEAVV
jgi:hypothetical protein